MLETMNVKLRCLIFTTVLLGVALPASAITREEWEANPSLIPTPSADSEFYVVEPTAFVGAYTMSPSTMPDVDLTPVVRRYSNFFSTVMRTAFYGFILFVR